MASKKNGKKAKAVYTIKENGEYTNWTRVGVAFENKDGSMNILLDALPTNGKLHIRDFPAKKEEAQA